MGQMKALESIRRWAGTLKREIVALWIAARDPRTPVLAKILGGAIAAYALSPIDLIPDVIPVLGYLDDLLIVPLGIMLAVRLIPRDLMGEYREKASLLAHRPTSTWAAGVIVGIWIIVGVALVLAWFRHFGGGR